MREAKVVKMIIRLRDALNDACNTGMYDEEEIEACINIIRADERKKAEQDFQNSDYWNEYLAKVIADARAKVLDKIIDIVAIACKFDEDNKTEMKQYILEQLKKQNNAD